MTTDRPTPAGPEAPLPPSITPDQLRARVLYRDAALMVIDKPAGLAVHAGRPGDDRAYDARMVRWDPGLYGTFADERAGSVTMDIARTDVSERGGKDSIRSSPSSTAVRTVSRESSRSGRRASSSAHATSAAAASVRPSFDGHQT